MDNDEYINNFRKKWLLFFGKEKFIYNNKNDCFFGKIKTCEKIYNYKISNYFSFFFDEQGKICSFESRYYIYVKDFSCLEDLRIFVEKKANEKNILAKNNPHKNSSFFLEEAKKFQKFYNDIIFLQKIESINFFYAQIKNIKMLAFEWYTIDAKLTDILYNKIFKNKKRIKKIDTTIFLKKKYKQPLFFDDFLKIFG